MNYFYDVFMNFLMLESLGGINFQLNLCFKDES